MGNAAPHFEVADIMRLANEALATQDRAVLKRCLAPNVVWHLPGRGSLAGDYEGREGVVRLLDEIARLTEGTFEMKAIDVMIGARGGVLWQHVSARREGRRLEQDQALICEVREGGVAEVWQRPDQYAWDGFFPILGWSRR